jgi:hypothetical protein
MAQDTYKLAHETHPDNLTDVEAISFGVIREKDE